MIRRNIPTCLFTQIQYVQISVTDCLFERLLHQAESLAWREIVAAPSGARSKYPNIGAA